MRGARSVYRVRSLASDIMHAQLGVFYQTRLDVVSARNDCAQRERSHILATIFATLREESVSKWAVADQLQIDVDELDKLVFGLMLVSLNGGAETTTRSRSSSQHLRVVK